MKNYFLFLFLAFLFCSCESTEIDEKTVELSSRGPSTGIEPIEPINVVYNEAVFLETSTLDNVRTDSNQIFCGGGGVTLSGTPNYFDMNNIDFLKTAGFLYDPFYPNSNGIDFSNELKRIIEVIYPKYYMFPVAPGQHYVVDGYYSFTYFEENIPHVLTPSQSNALRDKILLAIQQHFGTSSNNLYINETYVSTDYLLCATEWGLITVSFQYGHYELD